MKAGIRCTARKTVTNSSAPEQTLGADFILRSYCVEKTAVKKDSKVQNHPKWLKVLFFIKNVLLKTLKHTFLYFANRLEIGLEYFKSFKPILLLDDIFDKLDDSRVMQIIQLVSENNFGQVFITDTQRQRIEKIFKIVSIDHKIFSVVDGVAEAVKD